MASTSPASPAASAAPAAPAASTPSSLFNNLLFTDKPAESPADY